MKFTHAIVRIPCAEMIHGITSASLGAPDYEKALLQHKTYCNALRECGITLIQLKADNRYPDSTFVEDTLLITPHCAIITRPGAPSRRGEVESMRQVIKKYRPVVDEIVPPGTLDAGDVMEAEGTNYIGLSTRTNREGAEQLRKILQKYEYKSFFIPLSNLLHLKSGMAFLEGGYVVMQRDFENLPGMKQFRHIVVNENESYAANCLWINGKVLVAAGFPETDKKIKGAGYETVPLDVSEFRKLDGGLSCLSVRF